MNNIESSTEALKIHFQSAKDSHYFLYNSLLTFNGLLISAFSIIVTLKPTAYAPFIFPYFFSLFVPVFAVVASIYQVRLSSVDLISEKFSELYEINTALFKDCSETFINRYCKKPKNLKKNNRLIRLLDKMAILFTLLNPILLFIIIYVTK